MYCCQFVTRVVEGLSLVLCYRKGTLTRLRTGGTVSVYARGRPPSPALTQRTEDMFVTTLIFIQYFVLKDLVLHVYF